MVLVMSSGEIIIYSGINPGSDFVKVGSYQASPPIGRRCLTRIGGDLVVLTKSGLLPISLIMQGWDVDKILAQTSYGKVAPGIRDNATIYGGVWGWQAGDVTANGRLYVNVPQNTTPDQFIQYVLNTYTGAWGRAKGLTSYVWAEHDGDLYYGGAGGVVYKHAGLSDAGTAITGDLKTAFVAGSSRPIWKHYTQALPLLLTEGSISNLKIGIDTDFREQSVSQALNPTSLTTENSTPWGSPWGSPWGTKLKPTRAWVSINGRGRHMAFRLRSVSSSQTLSLAAIDVAGIGGGL